MDLQKELMQCSYIFKITNNKKGRSPAKNGSKVPNRVTTLNPYKSGLEWTFEALPVPQIISWESSSCRKRTWVNCTSGGRAMAV